MIDFQNSLPNVYLVFLVRFIVITKNISINRKQIEIIQGFAHTIQISESKIEICFS